MVRKGKQHRSDTHQKTTNNREVVADSVDISLSEEKERSEAPSWNNVDRDRLNGGNLSRSSSNEERVNEANRMGSGRKNKQRPYNVPSRAKADVGNTRSAHMPDNFSVRNAAGNGILDAAGPIRNDGTLSGSSRNQSLRMLLCSAMEDVAGYFRPSVEVISQRLRVVALNVLSASSEWIEQQKPQVLIFKSHICHIYDQMLVGIKHLYPIIWTWLLHLGQLVFVLSVIWLDCTIRGLNSLLRLGTASFFTVVWCSILSIITMVGFTKALIVMVISALVAVFFGLGLGILILAILGTVSLWLYGSFWTTALVIVIGGSSFASYHERVALLVTTTYSMYCARYYVGWLGLFLGLNLSFLSSDLLIYFLGKSINEQGSYYSREQDNQTPGRARDFYGEPSHPSPADDVSASRRSGEPSTSGSEVELTSEGEVIRLLNCNDHYSALGFTRFENIDVSLLKREYRKKAMLVHPDKNMGNEKAAEAFKKLQNAYEVLLDTLKRKTYDDELRREELLNYFRRFQTLAQKNRKNNFFRSGSPHHFEPEDEGSPEESRRIACKKCGDFHKWTRTERSKSRARWCQDCNDFHPAKDGDGWLEQSLSPLLFGLLHKADAPRAYVCAESRIYNATEWFICQGMRCPPNTHKASFHVNTSLSSKPSKGSSSSHRSGGGTPNASNVDETMTEEELFEWLQNAMQSGAFEASGGPSNESPSSKNSSSAKGNSTVKKKKKGKKQW